MRSDPFWIFIGTLSAVFAVAALLWAVHAGRYEHLVFAAVFAGASRLYFREFR